MKTTQFSCEQLVDCWEEWLEKLHNFLRETRMGIGCLSNLSAQFSQSAERARSAASAQFLRGVSPGVAIGPNSLVDQHEG